MGKITGTLNYVASGVLASWAASNVLQDDKLGATVCAGLAGLNYAIGKLNCEEKI